MASGRNKALLEDIFEILEVDPDGKKFDKGERISNVRLWICFQLRYQVFPSCRLFHLFPTSPLT